MLYLPVLESFTKVSELEDVNCLLHSIDVGRGNPESEHVSNVLVVSVERF